MNEPSTPDLDLENRLSGRLLDVLIRAGLVFAMAVLCYQIFSPFLALMVWALILAVTLYPAHQKLAHRMGEKQGLAATTLVLGGIALIGIPTAVLMFELGDSVQDFIGRVRDNTLQIPAPSPGGRRVADRRQVDLWALVAGSLGFAGSRSEPAAEARRPSEKRVGDCCQHRRRAVAVSGLLHHCRNHHGLLASRAPEAPCPFSIASSAQGRAKNLQSCPRRPSVRWR